MNYIGMHTNQVESVVKSLNTLLANYHLYYQNLRNFHWNVQGENFFDLHQKFEELYNDARVKIDEIAERILTLRDRPLSTISSYLDHAQIEEAKQVEDDREMVAIILRNHKILIDNFREVIEKASESGDEGTIDMVGSFLANLEKKSWMLDAWLNAKVLQH